MKANVALMLQCTMALALLTVFAAGQLCEVIGVTAAGQPQTLFSTGTETSPAYTLVSNNYAANYVFTLRNNNPLLFGGMVTFDGEGTLLTPIPIPIGLSPAELEVLVGTPALTSPEQLSLTFTISGFNGYTCIMAVTLVPRCSISGGEGALTGNQDDGYTLALPSTTATAALNTRLIYVATSVLDGLTASAAASPAGKGVTVTNLQPGGLGLGIAAATGSVSVATPAGSTSSTAQYVITWSSPRTCSSTLTVTRPISCTQDQNYCQLCSATGTQCATCKRGITNAFALDPPGQPTTCRGWASSQFSQDCMDKIRICANSPNAANCYLEPECPPCADTGCTASYNNFVNRGWDAGITYFSECRVVQSLCRVAVSHHACLVMFSTLLSYFPISTVQRHSCFMAIGNYPLTCDLQVCLPSAEASIDPHFVGFDGSRFDFHGRPDKYFSLISQMHHQISAYFFLANATIFHGPENGTFMGEIGVKYLQDEVTIAAQEAGTILVSVKGHGHLFTPLWSSTLTELDGGMTVMLQDKSLGAGGVAEAESVQYVDVVTPDISIRVYSPDDARARPYLNLQIRKVSPELLQSDMHGVIGQTAGWLVRGEGLKHFFPWDKGNGEDAPNGAAVHNSSSIGAAEAGSIDDKGDMPELAVQLDSVMLPSMTRKERAGSKPQVLASEPVSAGELEANAAVSGHTPQPFLLEGTTEDYVMPDLFSTNHTFNRFRDLSAADLAGTVSHQRRLLGTLVGSGELMESSAGIFTRDTLRMN